MVTRLSCLTGISFSPSQETFDYLFQYITQVTQQMPAVGDLSRIRSIRNATAGPPQSVGNDYADLLTADDSSGREVVSALSG